MKRFIGRARSIGGWRHFPLVAALLLILAFLTGFYWRELVRSGMCGPASEQCTREWISATGGWIAVVFAYRTIKTMNRQTEEANRHQRENIEMQLYEKLDAARRLSSGTLIALQICGALETSTQNVIDTEDYDNFEPDLIFQQVFVDVHESDVKLTGKTPRSFDTDPFEMKSVVLADIRRFETARGNPDEADIREILIELRLNVLRLMNGLQSIRVHADSFIVRWLPRIS